MKYPPEFTAFREKLESFGVTLTEESLELILPLVHKKQFKKGQVILKPGEICTEIYYIIKGMIRSYYKLPNGTEKTFILCKEHNLFGEHSSFISQKPSLDYVEAIEDTEIYYVSYEGLTSLYDGYKEWSILGRKISDVNFEVSKRRMRSLMNDDAMTRYALYLKTYKSVLHRVPQHIVASYLGITPQSLSRLKREFGESMSSPTASLSPSNSLNKSQEHSPK